MEELTTYILKSAGLLTIFFISYQSLLRKDTSFNLNRKYLIGGIFLSFILPAIQFTQKILIKAPVVNTQFPLEKFQNTSLVQEAVIDWWTLAGILYLSISGIMLSLMALRLCSILKLIRSYPSEKTEGFRYISIERSTGPFSFFSYIVYNPTSHSQDDLKLILQHEKVHAAQFHSIDIILANLTTAILWFNPASWWYKKSIEQNLEFLADRETVAVAGSRKAYQRALIKVSVPEFQPALTNHFHQSFIKKRIVMLNKKPNNKSKFWKISLIFPLLFAFMFFFNVKTEAQIIQKEGNSSEKASNTDALNTSKNQKNEEEPLYVLNGVPSKKAIIDTINPENINKVNVLKGTKATAVYGSSGRHGVILISTKTQSQSDAKFAIRSTDSKSITNKNLVIVIDGEVKEDSFDINSVNPETIEKMEVIKEKQEISRYSKKDKDGVIKITTKNSSKNSASKNKHLKIRKTEDVNASENSQQDRITIRSQQEAKPLTVLNGKVMTESYDSLNIDPSDIESINVLKGEAATKKYGDKGINGVIEIYTKGYVEETDKIHITGYGE